jgi:hypothetical protein
MLLDASCGAAPPASPSTWPDRRISGELAPFVFPKDLRADLFGPIKPVWEQIQEENENNNDPGPACGWLVLAPSDRQEIMPDGADSAGVDDLGAALGDGPIPLLRP